MRELKSPFGGPLSPADAAQLGGRLKAVTDTTRLQIIGLLAAEPCLSGVELVKLLGTVSQPTVSHHLAILAKAGLIRWEKRGVYVLNRLDLEGFAELVRLLTPGGGTDA